MNFINLLGITMLFGATAAGAQVGVPVPSMGGSVGATTETRVSPSPTGNARGDRARTGRDAVATRRATPTETPSVNTPVPTIAGSATATTGSSVDGDGSATTSGTVGAGGTIPDAPR